MVHILKINWYRLLCWRKQVSSPGFCCGWGIIVGMSTRANIIPPQLPWDRERRLCLRSKLRPQHLASPSMHRGCDFWYAVSVEQKVFGQTNEGIYEWVREWNTDQTVCKIFVHFSDLADASVDVFNSFVHSSIRNSAFPIILFPMVLVPCWFYFSSFSYLSLNQFFSVSGILKCVNPDTEVYLLSIQYILLYDLAE